MARCLRTVPCSYIAASRSAGAKPGIRARADRNTVAGSDACSPTSRLARATTPVEPASGVR